MTTKKEKTPKKAATKATAKKTEPAKKDAPKKEKGAKKEKNEHGKPAPVQTGANKTAHQPMTTPGTGKKRLMVSYEKLPPEVIEVIRTKYPYGYNHDLKEVKGIDNKKFFVLPIELPDAIYLVKVDLRKPIKIQDTDDEEDIFTPEEEFAGEDDNFPSEDLDQMEGDDEGEENVKKKKKKDEDEEDEE